MLKELPEQQQSLLLLQQQQELFCFLQDATQKEMMHAL